MAERRRAWIVKPPNWYCGIGISLIDSISKVYNTEEILKGLSRDLIDFSTWMFRKLHCKELIPKIGTNIPVSDLYIPTIDLPILLQEICGPILGIYKWFQFPHSCVCERFIYSYDRSAYSAAGNIWTDRGIYKSLTDT
jgi:hypothetical protein